MTLSFTAMDYNWHRINGIMTNTFCPIPAFCGIARDTVFQVEVHHSAIKDYDVKVKLSKGLFVYKLPGSKLEGYLHPPQSMRAMLGLVGKTKTCWLKVDCPEKKRLKMAKVRRQGPDEYTLRVSVSTTVFSAPCYVTDLHDVRMCNNFRRLFREVRATDEEFHAIISPRPRRGFRKMFIDPRGLLMDADAYETTRCSPTLYDVTAGQELHGMTITRWVGLARTVRDGSKTSRREAALRAWETRRKNLDKA